MKRPVIGLTTAFTKAKWAVWDLEAVVLASRYPTALDRAGATPVLLPPNSGDPWEVLSRLDAIVFVGGADVNPGLYGAMPHTLSNPAHEALDKWDLALLKAAIKHNVPFLAICRGLHLLNVAQGGTLHQHLPDVVGHEGHRPRVGIKDKHKVKVAKGSMLEPIMGTRPEVVTYHHQGVDKLGVDLEPMAWADDGTIEALRLTTHPWGVAVQWHPEEDDSPLIKTLVDTVNT